MRSSTSRSRSVSWGNAPAPARGSRREVLDEAVRDRRAEHGLARRDGADRVEDLRLVRALDEVAARARPDGGEDRVVVLDHRQDEDADLRARIDDPAGRVDAARAGHLQVHQDDVGLELERERHGLVARRGLPDEVDVGDGAEQRAQAVPEERVVVRDQDAEAARRRSRAQRKQGADAGAAVETWLEVDSFRRAPRPARAST